MLWIYDLSCLLAIFVKGLKSYEYDEPPDDENTIFNNFESSWKEKDLIQWILQDYDKRSRPVFDNITTIIRTKTQDEIQQITIEFGLRLIQILDLNESEQVLTTSVRLLYRWKDLHLDWDPKDFQNINFVFIPSHLIWIPDIALYNYADERLEERRPCAAKVFSDGTVEWQPMAIYKSTCFVNIRYFPFDIQVCWLKFGPWTYDGFRVNITFYNNENYLDLSSLVPSPEWSIIISWANHTEVHYPCCDEPYPDISFYIRIKRSPVFYTYILILPCFLLSSLTLVLFWMPPESPAKMVLGMNIFVAFFLMLLLLQDTTPSASSNFPLIGTYYCVNMGIITLSTFLSCIIVNLHFRGDNMQEVPFWLKKLILNYAKKFLCINLGSNMMKPEGKSISTNRENSYKEQSKKVATQKDANKVHNISYFQVSRKQNEQRENKEEPLRIPNKHLVQLNLEGELKDVQDTENQNESTSYSNSVVSDPHLQIPLTPTVFPKTLSNSEFYRTLESYSPLHSPILKTSFQFIDENKTLMNNHNASDNSDSIYSTIPLLQDAVAMSLSQVTRLRESLQSDNLKYDPNIPIKKEKITNPVSNINVVDTESNPLGMSFEQHKRISNDVKLIVKSLKYIQRLQENKENVARIVAEWRSVGLVLDRIFFYCYLFTVVFSLIMYFPKTNVEE